MQQSFLTAGTSSTREQLIAAADALDVRSKLMQTEVPLSLFPRTLQGATIPIPHFVPDTAAKRPNVVVASEMARLQQDANLNHAAAESDRVHPTSEMPLTPLDVPKCPPPTRSVTPMLSLYATVKVSNIRKLP